MKKIKARLNDQVDNFKSQKQLNLDRIDEIDNEIATLNVEKANCKATSAFCDKKIEMFKTSLGALEED